MILLQRQTKRNVYGLKNNEKGPFGVYTLAGVNGKIKNTKKRYDPTDPLIKANKKIYTYAMNILNSIK